MSRSDTLKAVTSASPDGDLPAKLSAWLGADVDVPLIDALATSRFATESCKKTESDDAIRIRFGGPYTYVMGKAWAEKEAVALSGVTDAPKTSPAGQWRESYRAMVASFDCPGNRILHLFVFDTETNEVRDLNFEEGYGSRLLNGAEAFFAALHRLDEQGVLVAAEPDPFAAGEEDALGRAESLLGLRWEEL